MTALSNLRRICTNHLAAKIRIEIVDLVKIDAGAERQYSCHPHARAQFAGANSQDYWRLVDTERVLVGLNISQPKAE